LTKTQQIYSVSYFNLEGLKALFGGAKPPKARRGDGTVPNAESTALILQPSNDLIEHSEAF